MTEPVSGTSKLTAAEYAQQMEAYRDARRQHFPHEQPYAYQPFAGLEDQFRFDESARAGIMDHDQKDLAI